MKLSASLDEDRRCVVFFSHVDYEYFSDLIIWDNHYNLVVSRGWFSIPPYGYVRYSLDDTLSRCKEFDGIKIQLLENSQVTQEILIGENNNTQNNFSSDNSSSLREWVNWIQDNVYRESFFPKDVVYDLGANIGLYSKWVLSQNVKKCYSFEPNKQTFDKLTKNLSMFDNSECFNLAISPTHGTETLYTNDFSVSSSLFSRTPGDKFEVQTINLEDWIKTTSHLPPTIIKCDIEEYEWQVLESWSDDFIKRLKYLVVEFHFFNVPKTKLLDPIERLMDLGFSVELAGTNKDNEIILQTNKTIKFVNLAYQPDTHLE